MSRTAYLLLILWIVFGCGGTRQNPGNDENTPPTAKERKNCWQYANAPSLMSVITSVMQTPLEAELIRDSYIQTFGCAYEEIDIEKNSIQAVYRAIIQSLLNRNITVRDDLMALLHSRTPRPENLVREYTVYVNMPTSTGQDTVASYQIKILQLEVAETVESHLSVWTRIATRFRYREDHYKALPISDEKSDFVKVMEKSQKILTLAENGKMKEILAFLQARNHRDTRRPQSLAELTFGDQLFLTDELNPNRTYPAFFLGKGIMFTELPRYGAVTLKFGEERLYGKRLNTNNFGRLTNEFVEFGYKAPETILQCMFLKSSKKNTAKARREKR
jgi:hypothetical protein